MRERWAAGEAAIGGWLAIPSAFSAELVARRDFDYVCVDTQHGLNDYSDSWKMLQAVQSGLGHAPGAGAVERAGRHRQEPRRRRPGNHRSDGQQPGPGRGGGASLPVRARRRPQLRARAGPAPGRPRLLRKRQPADVAVVPMVETAEAVDNLDDILSVPGVDAVYVGPSDLSVSLGLPPGNNDGNAAFDDAMATIVAGCVRHGVVAGCHTAAELCQQRISEGFRMITVTTDVVALTRALEDELRRARGQDPVERSGSLY